MLARPEASDRKWFVLLIEPQMERKAAASLIGRRFKPYLPEETVWRRRGHRRHQVQVRQPIFRGYLFIHLGFQTDAGRWDKVTNAPGVHKFLAFHDGYAVVPNHQMDRLFDVEQVLLKPREIRGPSEIFEPGEQVRVMEGPFTGLNASIARLDDGQRITILLSLLGRAVPIHIEAEHLEKL